MVIENDRYRLESENGVITNFYYKKDGTNLVDKNGGFGTACFTYVSDDITSIPHDEFTPYAERCSVYNKYELSDNNYITFADTSDNIELVCGLDDRGLDLLCRTNNENISCFGININLNFMSKKGTEFKKQYLPTSPYTSDNGKFMYCIMTRPDGRFLTVTAMTECDGWKIKYSPFSAGHYIMNFQFLASFDKAYKGSGRKTVRVNIQCAESIEEAYGQVCSLYEMPMCINLLNGGFDDFAIIKTIGNATSLKIKKPSGAVIYEKVHSILKIDEFGFYTVIPIKDGKEGLSTTVWNGKNMKQLFDKSCDAVKKPYHPDENLCEGGCFLWAILVNTLFNNSRKYEDTIKEQLEIIMGKREYVPRRTIVSHAVGDFAAYHICDSERVQEQFFGVSILIEAYKMYKKREILEFAIKSLTELVENYMQNGMVYNGKDYTTVCCPAIPLTDMANILKEMDDNRSGIFETAAIELAEYLCRRGFDFPTEGVDSDLVDKEYEDGSISCTALSLLYICKNLKFNNKYLDFASEVLDFHNAWVIYTPDARMNGSSFRWWETIWEGDGQGPAICAGHAWTIWRAEAQFLRGILQGDDAAMIDSWNAFITNFAKTQSDGVMYSCYEPDYIRGGGLEGIQRDLMQLSENDYGIKYETAHSYPIHSDNSLSRYAWVRNAYSWLRTSMIFERDGVAVGINATKLDGAFVLSEQIKDVYLSKTLKSVRLRCNHKIRIISDIKFEVICGKMDKNCINPKDGIIELIVR